MTKLLISSHNTWSIFNFRQNLIRTLIANGNEIHIYAPVDSFGISLKELGCIIHDANFQGTSKNIFKELVSLLGWIYFIRKNQFNLCLHFGIKPNLYGSIACILNRVPYINNITGLGQIFQKKSMLQKLVVFLYTLTQKKAAKIFFQNKDDYNLFFNLGILSDESNVDLLPGSGVDLERFKLKKNFDFKNKKIKFYFFGRILVSKGVILFVDAAEKLINIYGKDNVEFCILGFIEANPNNKDHISYERIQAWEKRGLIKYLGQSNQIEKNIIEADCIVLPSYYREGTPRSLLEACALGLPIITTNSVGCKDVVIDCVNGYMIEPNDIDSLVNALISMINLTHEERQEMGMKGREIIEEKFDENIVISKYLQALKEFNV